MSDTSGDESEEEGVARRRKRTREEAIFGVFAEGDEDDDASDARRRGAKRGGSSLQTPVAFVSAGQAADAGSGRDEPRRAPRARANEAGDVPRRDEFAGLGAPPSRGGRAGGSRGGRGRGGRNNPTAPGMGGAPPPSAGGSDPLTSGIGGKLLAQMGWRKGQGLGRKGEGITEPIEVRLRPERQGLAYGGREVSDLQKRQARRVLHGGEGRADGSDEGSADEADAAEHAQPRAQRGAAPPARTAGWRRGAVRTVRVKSASALLSEGGALVGEGGGGEAHGPTAERAGAEPGSAAGLPGVVAPVGEAPVLDMTGRSVRVRGSVAEAMAAAADGARAGGGADGDDDDGSGEAFLPELRHNVRMLAELAGADVHSAAEAARRASAEAKRTAVSASDLRARVAAARDGAARAQRLCDRLRACASVGSSRELLDALEQAAHISPMHFGSAAALEALIALASPHLRATAREWQPLTAPAAHAAHLRRWRALLTAAGRGDGGAAGGRDVAAEGEVAGQDEAEHGAGGVRPGVLESSDSEDDDDDDGGGDGGGGGARRGPGLDGAAAGPAARAGALAYERLVYHTFMPALRSALINGWALADELQAAAAPSEEPARAPPIPAALRLLCAWRRTLPRSLLRELRDRISVPKLARALDGWNPRAEPEGAGARAWLRPWLLALGASAQPLLPPAQHKLGAMVGCMALTAAEAVAAVGAWAPPVLGRAQWGALLVRHVSPRVAEQLDAQELNPARQSTTAVRAALRWLPVLGPDRLGGLLAEHFFPRWAAVLRRWLRQPAVELLEVERWYVGWRSVLPAELLTERHTRAGLDLALDAINERLAATPAAAGGAPAAAGGAGARRDGAAPPHPARSAAAGGPRGATAEPAPRAQPRAAPLEPDADVSALDALGALALERDLPFLPREGRRAPTGQQVYALGHRAVSCYVDRDKGVIFARATPAEPWCPISLHALLELAAGPP